MHFHSAWQPLIRSFLRLWALLNRQKVQGEYLCSHLLKRWGTLAAIAILTAVVLAVPGYGRQAPVDDFSGLLERGGHSATRDTASLLQLPLLESLEELAPPDVQAFLVGPSTVGSAPVQLDGRVLFYVADAQVPAEVRSQEIEQRLRDFASLDEEDDSEVDWEEEAESNQPILYVNGEFLMTVTAADGQLEGLQDLTIRARQLQAVVSKALRQYRAERQPESLRRAGRNGIFGLLIAGLISLSIGRWQHRLTRRRQAIQQQLDAPLPELDDSRQFEKEQLLRQQIVQRQQRNWIELQRGGLLLLQGGLWAGSLLLMLGLFPYTRWLQPLLIEALRLPLRVGLVVLGAYALTRLSNMVIDRFYLTLQRRAVLSPQGSERLSLRLSTFSQVSKSIVASGIVVAAAVAGLSLVGINLTPLLAGAGLIGLGLSLAAQSLVKDIINGFLILFEDQYGVGDVVVIDSVAGFVETMNLRMTQLRNEEGRLITVPNSQIQIVQNLSKEWSRVDLMVTVALQADIDQAIALIHQVADEMTTDPDWQTLILEKPLMLGVDCLDHGGATVRIWIKTLPLKQWDVAREYRRRLKIAFDQAQVPIGVPQQSIILRANDEILGLQNGQRPLHQSTDRV
ncbi:MAG: mechanosensitive ion channel family protein [Cyanobacteria bacterium P01_H01_bin.119]